MRWFKIDIDIYMHAYYVCIIVLFHIDVHVEEYITLVMWASTRF